MQRLLGLVTAETALIYGLHHLSARFSIDIAHFDVWLRFTPAQEVVMAVLRLVALSLAYWLAGSTALYGFGLLAKLPGLVRSVEWATLPAVRRIAHRAVALSIATATPTLGLVAPVLATPPPEVAQIQQEADDSVEADTIVVSLTDDGLYLPPGATLTPPSQSTSGTVSTPTLRPAAKPQPVTSPVAAVPTPALAAATPTPLPDASGTYTVERGDNLWDIAEAHLSQATSTTLSDADVAPYWARVVELNRDTIASGNPDWINPGEVIKLPPLED